MKNKIEYIDKPEQLNDLCQRIQNISWIAVDTEFLREKTYFPQFCLLQLATPDWVVCVDPIKLKNLDKLFDVLLNTNIIKVFHSSRQDLEIFYCLTGKLPTPIFDTQIAAPLLGFAEGIGYTNLVSTLLNINLTKTHTRADWSARPLSPDEIQYAADDVIYLCEIYQKMVTKLKELGRLEWLNDDFLNLENPEQYILAPEKAWLKVKGKTKLGNKQLSIVQAISRWREEAAQKENCPRSWLLRDEMLLDFGKLQPETLAGLSKIRNLNKKIVNRYGHELCNLVKMAKNTPPIPFPIVIKNVQNKEQQREAIIDILFAFIRIRAEENSLNPVCLATREDLNLFLNGEECLILKGWRHSLAGQELLLLLDGKVKIKIEKQTLNFFD